MMGFVCLEGESGCFCWVWELCFVNGKGFDLCFCLLQGFEVLEVDCCIVVGVVFICGNVQIVFNFFMFDEWLEVVINEEVLVVFFVLKICFGDVIDFVLLMFFVLFGMCGIIDFCELVEVLEVVEVCVVVLFVSFCDVVEVLCMMCECEGLVFVEVLFGYVVKIEDLVLKVEVDLLCQFVEIVKCLQIQVEVFLGVI